MLVRKGVVLRNVVEPAPSGIDRIGVELPLTHLELRHCPAQARRCDQLDERLLLRCPDQRAARWLTTEAVEDDAIKVVALHVIAAEHMRSDVQRDPAAIDCWSVKEQGLVDVRHLDVLIQSLGLVLEPRLERLGLGIRQWQRVAAGNRAASC